MKEKCKNCAHPSKACVSFIMTLTTRETIEWCKLWKDRFGWSNATMSEQSGVPIGTIHRVFSHSKTEEDYAGIKLATIRPIICALTGCTLEELESCENQAEPDGIALAKVEYQAETIRRLEAANARLRESAAEADRKHAEEVAFLKETAKARLRIIIALAISLAVALLVIIAALVIDRLNDDIGFFWIDRLVHAFDGITHGIGEVFDDAGNKVL